VRRPVNIAGWLRHQVRGLGSLGVVILVVFGVLAFALVSMNPPDYSPRLDGGADSGGPSANAKAPQSRLREPAQLFLQASAKRPIPLVADIEIHGWKNRASRIVDASVTDVEPLEPEGMSVAVTATAYPVKEVTEQLRGKRVLASVGPEAASVLPGSGKARVGLVVTPSGQTASVLIDEVREPVSSVLVSAAADMPQPAGAVAASAAPALRANVSEGTGSGGTALSAAVATRAYVQGLTAYFGVPGTVISLTGRGFGAPRRTSWVSCAGVRAPILSWSDTQIRFVIPSKMKRQGYIGVVKSGRASNGLYFSPFNQPRISSISPREGAPGTAVTLSGINFGRSQSDGWVTFAGATAQVISWSDTSIRVLVPRDAVSGFAGVVTHGMTSNGVLYAPLGRPLVESVSRRVLHPGDIVSIQGRNLGVQPGVVVIDGAPVRADAWSQSEVTFTVPRGTRSGYVGVVRNDSHTSNGLWRPYAPRMVSLSRWWAAPGTDVELRGIDFGSQQGTKQVFVGGTEAAVKSWSDTVIVATVPNLASGTTHYVGVGTLSACSNGIWMVVANPARIDAISSRVVHAGDRITLTGSGFGPETPTSRVLIAGSDQCQVESWTDTTIEAIVPEGAGVDYVGVFKRGVTSNGVWVMRVP